MFNKRNRKNTTTKENANLSNKEEETLDSYEEEIEDYTTVEEETEDYQEFRDVGVYEEERKYRRYKRISNIIFTIIMIILAMIAIDVIAVGRYNKGPFFAIPVRSYKDGGTKEYLGFGYRVIKYHQVQGRRDKEIGFWSLKYNTDPITVEDVDLAIEFTGNEYASYQKYYKKFVRVISTLKKVNEEKHQITIGYTDEDGKYSIDVICKMSEDQEDISNFENGKEITIIGTVNNFKGRTDTKNNRIYVTDCFAEQ